MIALIQRVSEASVTVGNDRIAEIGYGLLALIGIQQTDSSETAQALAKKLVSYRVFSDDQGKMNLDLRGVNGELLIVPQFTLAADTRKGRRPGFSLAAPPDLAESLFKEFERYLQLEGVNSCQGQFGADMQVALVNDGPVTFWLQV